MLKKCCKRPILLNFSNGIGTYLFDSQNDTNHRFLWCKNTDILKRHLSIWPCFLSMPWPPISLVTMQMPLRWALLGVALTMCFAAPVLPLQLK